jgi:hypothetical protein
VASGYRSSFFYFTTQADHLWFGEIIEQMFVQRLALPAKDGGVPGMFFGGIRFQTLMEARTARAPSFVRCTRCWAAWEAREKLPDAENTRKQTRLQARRARSAKSQNRIAHWQAENN